MTPPTMKAIVLHQPWATLMALGVKTIETRPSEPCGLNGPGRRGYPGCRLERGERIAILAGAARPKDGTEVGDWTVEGWRDDPSSPCLVHLAPISRTDGYDNPASVPLGAVVCTVVVEDALPIRVVLPKKDRAPGVPASQPGDSITVHPLSSAGPTAYRRRGNNGHDVADQLPFGDFRPGRSGWLTSGLMLCDRPVPVVGRQGIFRLPADVADAVHLATHTPTVIDVTDPLLDAPQPARVYFPEHGAVFERAGDQWSRCPAGTPEG